MLILAIVSLLIGLFIIDYNQNNTTKHNLLLGVVGYVFVLIIPLGILGYKYF
jgi:hypothetical protein